MSTNDERHDELQEPILMEEEQSEDTVTNEVAEPAVADKETIDALNKFTDEDSGDLSISSILGGDILISKWMIKQVLFVIFIVVLCVAYTANRYESQQESLLIDSLRTQLQDVKYNVLTQSSELVNMTRQSNVEKMLRHTKDSLLQNPTTPPFLIRESENYPQGKPQQRNEVTAGQQVVNDTTKNDSVKASH